VPNDPALTEKDTGTPGRRLPFTSATDATTVTVPPRGDTEPGVAVSEIEADAAPPIVTVSVELVVVVPSGPVEPVLWALPENAVTVATPDSVPACSVTTAYPLLVTASRGSSVPRLDVNVTNVPLCAGVPLCSMTVAVICAVPLIGRIVRLENRVMIELLGASNGTLSHEPNDSMARPHNTTLVVWRRLGTDTRASIATSELLSV
jgi:hypothetical protein